MSDLQILPAQLLGESAGTPSSEFACLHCGASFRTGESLRVHALASHGEKNYQPFVCTWLGCERRFGWRSNFIKHLRVHTNTKPIKCRLCDYRCRNYSSLRWHFGKTHNEKYHLDEATDQEGNQEGWTCLTLQSRDADFWVLLLDGCRTCPSAGPKLSVPVALFCYEL